MKTHLADSFIRITTGGEQAIVHCEFQTHDSREVPMPFRMAGYIGSAIEFYKLPIYSHVVYLRPTAGRTDPGLYVQEVSGYNIGIQYHVLRLTEMDGQALLDTDRVGLVPFVALMKPPASVGMPEWIRHCVQTIEAGTEDESQQKETLADLAILGGLAYDSQTIREAISEVIVQESSIIQYFTEKALEQGIEQGKNSKLSKRYSQCWRSDFRPRSQRNSSLFLELLTIYNVWISYTVSPHAHQILMSSRRHSWTLKTELHRRLNSDIKAKPMSQQKAFLEKLHIKNFLSLRNVEFPKR